MHVDSVIMFQAVVNGLDPLGHGQVIDMPGKAGNAQGLCFQAAFQAGHEYFKGVKKFDLGGIENSTDILGHDGAENQGSAPGGFFQDIVQDLFCFFPVLSEI